ncbi:MAG TPA: class I SAM-dependent methyltransferase [Thermoplasmata archaeon]|nr:class I SAM-dependent methyltransferase [Thermoplasmata archaeon]
MTRRGESRVHSSVRRNRTSWDRDSAGYDRKFAKVLGGPSAMAWGLWRIPEAELGLLGPVRGKSVLELGCGAARWSAALARRGARMTALDLSIAQLRQAQAIQREERRGFPLVRAAAESLPFQSRAFDLIFSDWGALTFADPLRAVPECARVLRPGGHLVFAASSPFRYLTHDRRRDRQSLRLRRDYFGLHRLEFGSRSPVEYTLPYDGWFDLFVRSGLAVERLLETRPPRGARSSYLARSDDAFARRWPIECLWRLRRLRA